MGNTIKKLAALIKVARPKWRVEVDRGFYSTDRKIPGTRLRHSGKGRWGSKILVWDERGSCILCHNNAETYRRTSEVRAWMREWGIIK